MSQALRALLLAVACFGFGYLFFRVAEWGDRKGKVAQLFTEVVFAPLCFGFIAIGSGALISIGIEHGYAAHAVEFIQESFNRQQALTPVVVYVPHL